MLRSLTIIGICLFLVGCSTPGDDIPVGTTTPALEGAASGSPSPGATPAEGKPVRLEKTVIKTKQGQQWEMQAQEVDWMDNNSQAKAREVTWFLLGPKGERNIKVESKGADLDMDAEIVEFTSKVVAQRIGSEESLVLQHLVYNGKEKVFHGSEGVLWKRKGIELAGDTLTANANLDKVRLKGRVKGKTSGAFSKPGDESTPGQEEP